MPHVVDDERDDADFIQQIPVSVSGPPHASIMAGPPLITSPLLTQEMVDQVESPIGHTLGPIPRISDDSLDKILDPFYAMPSGPLTEGVSQND